MYCLKVCSNIFSFYFYFLKRCPQHLQRQHLQRPQRLEQQHQTLQIRQVILYNAMLKRELFKSNRFFLIIQIQVHRLHRLHRLQRLQPQLRFRVRKDIEGRRKFFKEFKFSIIIIFKECGNVYATNNVKIVGGIVANQSSWPSIAYIRWNYRGIYLLPNGAKVRISSWLACEGALISTRKILTAGKNQNKVISAHLFNLLYKLL